MNSPKLKGLLIGRLDKDEMNGIERLHMQISYSWLDSFVGTKNQESTMEENDFVIPIAHVLHFV